VTLPDRPFGTLIGWAATLPPEMLQAIGQLAVVTSEAEELLHRIYWRHAGLDEKTGPIVTDNINPKRLMEDILKLASLKSSEAKLCEDLQNIFKQFEEINTKRNHCVHWIWEVIENGPLEIGVGSIGMLGVGYGTPPTYQVKRPIYRQSGITEQPFSAADIQQLCTDTIWLIQRFRSHTLSEEELRSKRRDFDDLPPLGPTIPGINSVADLLWPAPWLDKPAPQASKP
jgi:hypothetical protein